MNNDQKFINSFLKNQIHHYQPNNNRKIQDNKLQLKRNDTNPLLQKLEYQKSKKNLLSNDYEEIWENNFIKQLKKQVQETHLKIQQNFKGIDYQGDSKCREIKANLIDNNMVKHKKKQYEKFKAYAVKMKIPTFHQTLRYKQKQEIKNGMFNKEKQTSINFNRPFSNNTGSSNIASRHRFDLATGMYSTNGNIQSLETNYQSKNIEASKIKIYEQQSKNLNDLAQIYKRKLLKTNSKLQTRKLSVKKQKQESYASRISSKDSMIKASSPKMSTKFKITFQQFNSLKSKIEQKDEANKSNNSIHIRNGSIDQKSNILFDKNHKQYRNKNDKNHMKTSSPSKELNKSFNKSNCQDSYLEKMNIAVHFKKKSVHQVQKKEENDGQKQKINTQIEQETKNYKRSAQENKSKSPEYERKSPLKNMVKTIYASKDVIKSKNQKIIKRQIIEDQLYLSKVFDKSKKTEQSFKILIFNSEDKYIRRILQSKQWITNPDFKSKFYHLKWVFKPNAEDYHWIKQGQFINHIKNSHQLTTKNCLNNNLKNYINNWPQLYKQYPKCYDLSKGIDKAQFYNEFIKEFMMILLQNCFSYLLQVKRQDVEQHVKFYQNLMEGNQYNSQNKRQSIFKKKNFRRIDMQNYRNYDSNCLLHMNLIVLGLKYWRNLRKNLQLQSQEKYHFLQYNKKQFQSHLVHLEKYSKMCTPSYFNNTQNYFEKEYYATPSNITLQRIVKEYVYFKHYLGYEWKAYGKNNVWIIKPCSASRGNGIYLENNCNDILSNKKGIQSKLVQKYIERPLLFNNPKYPLIKNKKFDIRQWVLLRSVQPLQIYMFSYCYIRICPQEYNINNINNLQSHLTNFSCNKGHFKNIKQSVMDYDSFKLILQEQRGINYQEILKPKIKDIIIKSIKSGQHLLKDFNQRCFSLLGYDIILDSYCEPWLLQINMSPACQERTEWLKIYLQQMGKGLMKIILPQNYFTNHQQKHQDQQIKTVRIDPITSNQKRHLQLSQNDEDFDNLQQLRTQNSQFDQFNQQQNKFQEYLSQQIQQKATRYTNVKQKELQQKNNLIQSKYQQQQQVQAEQEINYEQFLKIHKQNADQEEEKEEDIQNQQDNISQSWQELHFDQFLQQKNENILTPTQTPQQVFSLSLKQPQNHLNNLEAYIDQEDNPKNQQNYMQKSQQQKFNCSVTQEDKINGQNLTIKDFRTNFPIKNLYWQLICYEQYPALMKKNQHLQAIGTKMAPHYILEQQNMFNSLQMQIRKSSSIKVISNYLKSFKQHLIMTTIIASKIEMDRKHVTKARHNKNYDKRQVKSALQIQQDKSELFTKINLSYAQVSLTNDANSKFISKIKKDCKNSSFRQKIRTLVSSTLHKEVNANDLQEIVLANKKLKTRTLKQMDNSNKKGISQNYIY